SQRRLSTGEQHHGRLVHIPRRACYGPMKKKMYGEIQENLSIAQSPSLATLRFFLLQAGGWAVIGSAVQSFSESIANQSPWEYALQGLTPPGFSAHRPVRQVHLRSFWIAKIQRRRNSMSAAN